jgi:dTDP-4-dehydrorhamnose reductase
MHVASAATRYGAWVIYVSTDSVFDGEDGSYSETDSPNPINTYAITKLDGERQIRDLCPQHLIVRTNFYGYRMPSGHSLGEWLMNELSGGKAVGGFTNVHFNPLFVDQVVQTVFDVWSSGARGIVHIGSEGTCSKYQFARELAGHCGFDLSLVEPTVLDSTMLSAPRPLNTTLDTAGASRSLSRSMPTRQSGLVEFAHCVRSRDESEKR